MHQTCKECGTTLSPAEVDDVLTCPNCGSLNYVASDHSAAIAAIESSADARIQVEAVRRLALEVKQNTDGVRLEWFADRILEITE